MSEAVQKPVQDRDGAVQAERTYKQLQRRPGDRAILVSERATVFDRPRADLAPVDPVDEIRDPIWNHKEFRTWTPDLVHCRLLVCGDTIKRLPPAMRSGFVSQMGSVAIAEMTVARRMAPSPAEISALDWTWPRLVRLEKGEPSTLQRILMAAAFGASLDDIVKVLGKVGIAKGKSTVGRWYMAEKLRMAADWQASHHPVDTATIRHWHDIFDRARK